MNPSLSVAASRPLVKHPAESLLLGIDFRRQMSAGEQLSSPVSLLAEELVETPGEPLAIPVDLGSAAVNGAPFPDGQGGVVPAGAGVRFRVSGGSAPADFRLTLSVATTLGNIRTGVCLLQVRAS